MKQYRWLLFDADNTLFDFDAAEEYALNLTLMAHHVSITTQAKDCYRAINSALWAAGDRGEISQEALVIERFRQFFSAQGIQGDPEAWNRLYLSSLAHCPALLPGAEKLCYKLSQRYVLALVTNGISFVQRRRLEASPLGRFFAERVFISGEMGCRKPEKVFFDMVLDQLGAARHKPQVLVIGDSLSSDIRGAFNARLDSAWLDRRGASPGAIRPTYRFSTFSELEKLLIPPLCPFP